MHWLPSSLPSTWDIGSLHVLQFLIHSTTDTADFYDVCIKRVQVHPDVNRDDPRSKDKFLRLRDAYTVLSSPELRHEYDMELQWAHGRSQSQTYRSHFTEDSVPPELVMGQIDCY